MTVGTLLTHRGNGQEQHQHQQRHKHHTQQGIGLDQDAQIALFQRLKAGIVERGPLGRVERGETSLDIVHRHKHARQRSDGVERLGQVQAACGRLVVTHAQDIGVGRGFEERQAAGEDEVGDEERCETADGSGRDEQQYTQRIQGQSHDDAALERVATDEQRRRQGHAEVTAIEGHLHQCALGYAHAEYLGKSLDHWVSDVVGKAPQGKTARHHDEREHIAHALACYQ